MLSPVKSMLAICLSMAAFANGRDCGADGAGESLKPWDLDPEVIARINSRTPTAAGGALAAA